MRLRSSISRCWERTGGRVFYGWRIVFLGSLISAVGAGIMYHSFTVFFLPLKRDLGVSSAAISLLYGASRIEGGIEGPIVGRLIDRFGPRAVILGGATLAGVGFLLLATAHSFLAFFLIYVLVVSLGYNAGFFSPVSAAVNNWFIRRRGTGFGIISAGSGIGGMVMAPLLSYLALNFGWRSAAVVAGLLILAVALPAALPIQHSPEVRGLVPDGKPPSSNCSAQPIPVKQAAGEAEFTVREALKTFAYWLLTLTIALRMLVTVALTAHLIPILVWRGMGEASAAYLVSLSALVSVPAMLVMGRMGDRRSKPLLCAVGILPAVVTMLGVVLSQSSAALFLLPIGLAIAMGTTPLNWAIIGDFFGRRSYATLRGTMGVSYSIATFLSPIYAGWMFDRTGSYATVLISFSAVLVVAAILFAMLRQPSR